VVHLAVAGVKRADQLGGRSRHDGDRQGRHRAAQRHVHRQHRRRGRLLHRPEVPQCRGTGYVTLSANNPVPDPAIGHVIIGHPRSEWATSWRFAVAFQCSTWDGSAYATDGFARLYLNGNPTPLLSAENVKIPMRFTSNSNLRYSISPYLDCDRIWARALPTLLPTNADGAMTGAAPADLIFFEDFDGGLYPNWTEFTFFSGFPATPYAWSDGGGGGGWGVSVRCSHPSSITCESGHTSHDFAGLYREASSDVIPPPPPPPPVPPACVHGCLLTDTAIAGGGQGCRLPPSPGVECA
jgi:hypothetical protein